jgi:hypothetical protein
MVEVRHARRAEHHVGVRNQAAHHALNFYRGLAARYRFGGCLHQQPQANRRGLRIDHGDLGPALYSFWLPAGVAQSRVQAGGSEDGDDIMRSAGSGSGTVPEILAAWADQARAQFIAAAGAGRWRADRPFRVELPFNSTLKRNDPHVISTRKTKLRKLRVLSVRMQIELIENATRSR